LGTNAQGQKYECRYDYKSASQKHP
jgi:hypothetical protein